MSRKQRVFLGSKECAYAVAGVSRRQRVCLGSRECVYAAESVSSKNASRLPGRVGGRGLDECFGHVVCGVGVWCVTPVACLRVGRLGFRTWELRG